MLPTPFALPLLLFLPPCTITMFYHPLHHFPSHSISQSCLLPAPLNLPLLRVFFQRALPSSFCLLVFAFYDYFSSLFSCHVATISFHCVYSLVSHFPIILYIRGSTIPAVFFFFAVCTSLISCHAFCHTMLLKTRYYTIMAVLSPSLQIVFIHVSATRVLLILSSSFHPLAHVAAIILPSMSFSSWHHHSFLPLF